jgi:hypothetical protein
MAAEQSDILTFFSTCNIQELKWFVDSTVAWLTRPRPSPEQMNTIGFHGEAIELRINKNNRTISYPSLLGLDSVEDWNWSLLSSLISELINAHDPAWDNSNILAKPSRIRCRATIERALQRLMRGYDFPESIDTYFSNQALNRCWLDFKDAFREVRRANNIADDAESMPTTPLSPKTYTPRLLYYDSLPRCSVFEKDVSPKSKFHGANVTLILPCADRSSRFPGHKPKWLLTQPNGRLMVVDAISTLDMTNVTRVVIGVLRDDFQKYCSNDPDAVFAAFHDGPLVLQETPITLCVIGSETVDQVQTIECMLRACEVSGPIFIKDCDSSFMGPVAEGNGIAYMQITRDILNVSTPADKPYITIDDKGRVNNIVEKAILGDNVCVGGYSFRSGEKFGLVAKQRRDLMKQTACADTELAISDVIWGYMTPHDKHIVDIDWFFPIPIINYNDWGTLSAWKRYVRTFSTLFIDLDGTLFKNSGQYFAPKWGSQPGLPENLAYVRSLRHKGRTQIILTTSRPESLRAQTELQLELWQVPYDQLVMSILQAQRIVINDYSNTDPFPSARAVNLRQDADDLRENLVFE